MLKATVFEADRDGRKGPSGPILIHPHLFGELLARIGTVQETGEEITGLVLEFPDVQPGIEIKVQQVPSGTVQIMRSIERKETKKNATNPL